MGEGPRPAQERTALWEALLRDVNEGGQPLATRRTIRLMAWLRQRHLAWLLLPWLVMVGARVLLPGQRAAQASEDHIVDLYCQASGVDRQAARDEVWRLGGQLAPLVDRPEFVGLAQTAEPPGAKRAELEAAADALLAHSLAGRRTDDELLGAVLELWAEHEGSLVHGDERLVHQGITGRRAQTRAMLSEVEAWRKRYRLAWRRWFDQQAEHGSATSPGQR
jgi:hypothetical protein